MIPTIHRGHRIQARAFRGLCIIDRTGAVLYEDCGTVESARLMIDLLLSTMTYQLPNLDEEKKL